MFILTLTQAAQAASLLYGIFSSGINVFNQIKAVLAAAGWEGDTTELDRMIIDAETRRQRRDQEATKEV